MKRIKDFSVAYQLIIDAYQTNSATRFSFTRLLNGHQVTGSHHLSFDALTLYQYYRLQDFKDVISINMYD